MTYLQSYFKKTRGNKYGAKSQTYNGITYHSKREALYASELDLRVRAHDIKSWERQVKIELNVILDKHKAILTSTPALELKQKGYQFIHIHNYYVDFKILHNDGSVEYAEVKGMELEPWITNWKLTEAIMHHKKNVKLSVVK